MKKLLVPILIFFVFLMPTYSQENLNQNKTGITGEVVNYENGALIPNAQVIVEGKDIRKEIKTDEEGNYKIELSEGVYKITVSATGFKTFARKKINLNERGFFTLNINLKYGKPIIVD